MNLINFVRELFHQPYFICFLAMVSVACFYHLKDENSKYRKIVWLGYSSIFAGALLIFISSAIFRIYQPQVWDFTAFYLYGKTAALGYDFYLPEAFQLVFKSLDHPFQPADVAGFTEEVVNVGFLYPPPTILYFIPLGFLSFKTALIVWTIFNLMIVLACIYFIYNLFLEEYQLNGVFLASILLLIMAPSLSTISFSQTNFILLLLLLLMRKYSDSGISGLFLALAFFTKPYMVIFGVFFLLRMKWKPILYCIVSTLIIVGLTLVIVGTEPFLSYLLNNGTQRLPERIFSAEVNQSLNGVLLRHNLISLGNPLTYMYIVAGILIITTFYLLFLLNRKQYEHIWAVLLLVGLLVYPGMLWYYGTVLLYVVIQFLDEKKPLGFKMYMSIPIIGIFYFLSTFSVFITLWFLLGVIILHSSISLYKKSIQTC